MENLVNIIIYIHAFFGGIGLVAGTAVMIIKKGNSTHKKVGKIFSIDTVPKTV
ncbi:hypothetical protein [Empedobacter sp.]|uniref:hypothetical protein n=1 Tax=Empedobacter sp. TaxID=1927715 RepID=UPI0028A1262C|nr:hypothetical protein [Empedobacter sp.]